MAFIGDGRATAGLIAVENTTKAGRVVEVPRTKRAYSMAGTTGTIAAALAAGSAIATLRLSPTASPLQAYIEQVRISFVTIVAFTTPVTAGRRLAVYRGAIGASPSGGTPIADFSQKDPGAPASQCAAAQGGDARVATTAALTVTGVTWEAQPIGEMLLVHVGAAGAFYDWIGEFPARPAQVVLQPGQVLGIRNPAAMDAAGTWQATVNINWHEALDLSSSIVDT